MLQHEKMTQLHYALWAVATLVTFFISGCGGDRGPHRVVVSGAVAFKGQPIANGRIRFVPNADSHVPSVATNIIDGRYVADLHGGVPVGTHKIEIEAYHKPKDSAPNPLWVPNNYLPKPRGADPQMQITIEPADREITKNFDLTN